MNTKHNPYPPKIRTEQISEHKKVLMFSDLYLFLGAKGLVEDPEDAVNIRGLSQMTLYPYCKRLTFLTNEDAVWIN